MREPKVHVGILSETKIEFIFPDTYRVNEEEVSGKQLVLFDNGKILWKTTVTMNCCLNPCGKRLTLSNY